MKASHTETRRGWSVVAVLSMVALATAPIAAADLPTADELIAKYVAASGGEKVIRATKSMTSTGKMEMPAMGMSAEVSVAAMAPNKFSMIMSMPSVGEVKMGYDGEVAWADNPMTGAMLLEGDQADQVIKDSDFYADLNYQERYPTRETVEKTEFAGQAAYKVRLVDDKGKELFEYFAVDSGLKIGFEGEQVNEMGTVFVTTELTDYQEIDGRMVPMTTKANAMGMEMNMVLEKIEFNQVDESRFALPTAIKTLVESKSG